MPADPPRDLGLRLALLPQDRDLFPFLQRQIPT
jgi:hypothetical protein